MDGLTIRQEAFCMAYAKSGNATEAYKQAGYKGKSEASAAAHAARLLRNGKVQERLRQINAQIESDKIMGAVEMQEWFSRIIRGIEKEKDILPNGDEIEREIETKNKLKAAELLGKMQGAFLTRTEVDVKGAVPVVLKDDI